MLDNFDGVDNKGFLQIIQIDYSIQTDHYGFSENLFVFVSLAESQVLCQLQVHLQRILTDVKLLNSVDLLNVLVFTKYLYVLDGIAYC